MDYVKSVNKVTKLLNNRIFKAGFWAIGDQGVGQITRLGSNLVMTRLLVPEMFGVMAIANLMMIVNCFEIQSFELLAISVFLKIKNNGQ